MVLQCMSFVLIVSSGLLIALPQTPFSISRIRQYPVSRFYHAYLSQIEGKIVYFIFILRHMIIDNIMSYVRMSFFVTLVAFALLVFSTFATNSFSQTNKSISNSSLSNSSIANVTSPDESDDESSTLDNETSFASLSRSLAESNQADEPVPPPPSDSISNNNESDNQGASD